MSIFRRVIEACGLSVVEAQRQVVLPGHDQPTTITVHVFPGEEKSELNALEAAMRATQPTRRSTHPQSTPQS